MQNKKVLICGASGQLGSALINIFSRNSSYKVFGLSRTSIGKNFFKCDISDFKKLKTIINKLNPDIIINSAACVNVDICEKQKELAYNINFKGNNNILELSKINKSYFVLISSYYVFDGTKKDYEEDAAPTPINYYGITKIMAEIATNFYKESLIIRTSKIFSLGYDTRNFLARTYQSLIKGQEVMVIDDQFNNPIHADMLAESIMKLVSMKKLGIYNVGGKDYVSNYKLAKLFANYFKFDSSLIKPIKTKETNQAAQRPRYVKLSTRKLESKGIQTYNLNNMFKVMQKYVKNESKKRK